jgi:CTP-dependent riboflavin kinase
MSLKASSIAYRAKTHDSLAKLVLIGLADYADENGCASVDLDELAQFAVSSSRRVEQALMQLAIMGFINNHRSDDGKWIATIVGGAL